MAMEKPSNTIYNEGEMDEMLAAARVGDVDSLKKLLLPGMDINGRAWSEDWPTWGPSLLEAAVNCDQVETMRDLIREGADVNSELDKSTVLLDTASKGCGQALRLLVESGADIDRRHFDSSSVLHLAVKHISGENFERKMVLVDTILSLDFDVNTTDKFGFTALHRVAEKECFQMTDFLVSKGASVNATDILGETPLDRAASEGRLEVVQFLLLEGAHINAGGGCHGLALAAGNGFPAMVSFLLDHGAQRVSPRVGYPELLCAALGENYDTVSILYERGFAHQGPFSLCTAIMMGPLKAVELLLAQGIDVNTIFGRGMSTLHYALIRAASYHKVNILRLLLDNGADPDVRDENGQTVMDFALASNNEEAVKILETQARRI